VLQSIIVIVVYGFKRFVFTDASDKVKNFNDDAVRNSIMLQLSLMCSAVISPHAEQTF